MGNTATPAEPPAEEAAKASTTMNAAAPPGSAAKKLENKNDVYDRDSSDDDYNENVPATELDSSQQKKSTSFSKRISLDPTQGDGDHDPNDFPMRQREIKIGRNGTDRLVLNPVVATFATVVLWGLSIWCITDSARAVATLYTMREQITESFTWFYVLFTSVMMFYLLFLALKFGHIKLGPKDSEPEFNDFEYFTMLFSAGLGVGLFFFGVSEPLYHQSGNFYANMGYRSQDEVDMFALNLTIFHFGLMAWAAYLIVALSSGLASYRFKLPMTMRSCFYPILGEYTWGWPGDLIDALTIVSTVSGVCTSLGLGAIQLEVGLERVGVIDTETAEDAQRIHVVSIWVITCIATISVMSGLDVGIKYFSEFGFALGMLILTLVFCLDKTSYILNLFVQEIGYYFQWSILQLNFHTDAFGQLTTGHGRATDGFSADPGWMNSWTVFYIGWWVSWSAFVGLFIGRVSQGRTIGSVIFYTLGCTLFYTFLWFCTFGGVGLRQARQAMEMHELGGVAFNNTDYYLAEGSTYCYDVPQEDVVVEDVTIFSNTLLGVTPVCLFNPDDPDNAWFNVLFSYTYPDDFKTGFGYFLSWLSVVALTIYFTTSSDSGSLIVDQLAANGIIRTWWVQRVFWAFTEGALATALLVGGGSDGLEALQSASILTGLPLGFFCCFMALSIYKMCKIADENDKAGTDVTLQEHYHEHQKVFDVPVFGGVFNSIEYMISCGVVKPEIRRTQIPFPSGAMWKSWLVALALPWIPYYQTLTSLHPKQKDTAFNRILSGLYGIFFYLWIILFACTPVSKGFVGIAWTALLICACFLCYLRTCVRGVYNLEGNMLSDFYSSCFLYPQVLVQITEQLKAKSAHEMDTESGEIGGPSRPTVKTMPSSNIKDTDA